MSEEWGHTILKQLKGYYVKDGLDLTNLSGVESRGDGLSGLAWT